MSDPFSGSTSSVHVIDITIDNEEEEGGVVAGAVTNVSNVDRLNSNNTNGGGGGAVLAATTRTLADTGVASRLPIVAGLSLVLLTVAATVFSTRTRLKSYAHAERIAYEQLERFHLTKQTFKK